MKLDILEEMDTLVDSSNLPRLNLKKPLYRLITNKDIKSVLQNKNASLGEFTSSYKCSIEYLLSILLRLLKKFKDAGIPNSFYEISIAL